MGCFLARNKQQFFDMYEETQDLIQETLEDSINRTFTFKKKDLNQELICQKEYILGFHNLSIYQIRNAFFNLNDESDIHFDKIIIAFKYLGVNLREQQIQEILIPFLDSFVLQSQKIRMAQDYVFTNMIMIMIIMSSSSQKEKAKALFRINDSNNTNYLSKTQVEQMFFAIIQSVDQVSYNLLRQSIKQQSKNNKDLINAFDNQYRDNKQNIIDVRDKIVNIIYSDDDDLISYQVFIEKVYVLNKKIGQKVFTTNGIRQLIQQSIIIDLESIA